MHSSHNGRNLLFRMAGEAAPVLLLLTALTLLAGCALPWVPAYSSSSSSFQSQPPPIPFVWTRVTPPPPTPQQAYVAGMSQLRLCRSGTAGPATTTTWLVAGPTYGVALVLGDCSNDPVDRRQVIAILPISLDKSVQPRCPAWELEGGSIGSLLPADANLGQMAYQIPSWLPLPADSYEPGQMGGGLAPSVLFSLQSSTRIFITGRFQGSATQPTGAQPASISGRSGWQMSEHGIVTVTVPLADGWTFFFSGTANAATMQRLASAALGHLDTLLPKPQPLPADYLQATPAC